MPAISIENLSKYYRLGIIGGATFREEFSRWWAKRLGRPDPYAKIGQADHGNREGEYIWALRDINLKVEEGEILGVIGRNGAGKSTLLKILSRITAPTSGSAVIRGRVGSLLEVGTGFHPELTGRENIYLNGTILGMNKPEVDRKLDEIVEFTEISQFIDTPVKRYSSGMTVRLAFAVAAHLEPEILIVDEVLAVGDAAFQEKSLGRMHDIAGKGRTVMFVSHNLSSIAYLCSKGVVLQNGSIAYHGQTDDAITYYRNEINQACLHSREWKRPNDLSATDTGFLALSIQLSEHVDLMKQRTDTALHFKVCVRGITGQTTLIFGIYDQKLQKVSTINSGYTENKVRNINGVCEGAVLMQTTPLAPGIYSLNAAVQKGSVIVDHIENAITFEKKPGNFSSFKKIPSSQDGPVLLEHHWI